MILCYTTLYSVCEKETLARESCWSAFGWRATGSTGSPEARRGNLRHFCDDRVCPDPVWKLSTLD